MRTKWHQAPKWPAPGEHALIAQFGEARLVRYVNGTVQLRGGSETDRAQARAWIVRFLRDPALEGRDRRAWPAAAA